MNKLMYLFLLVGFISCSGDDLETRTVCLSGSLENGLIAFYPFDNGSLNDQSSNAVHLSNSTSAKPVADRMGNDDCAYQFNNSQGNSSFLTSSNTTFLNGLNDFSISLWYLPQDSTLDGGDYQGLFGRGSGINCPSRLGQWTLGLYDCRRAVFGHNNDVWANTITGLSNGCQGEVNALTDKWHHVVAIKNDDTYKLYFNAVLQSTSSGISSCTVNLAQDIGDLFIGFNFTGIIDDIIMYNRELSTTEVSLLFDLEPCCE